MRTMQTDFLSYDCHCEPKGRGNRRIVVALLEIPRFLGKSCHLLRPVITSHRSAPRNDPLEPYY